MPLPVSQNQSQNPEVKTNHHEVPLHTSIAAGRISICSNIFFVLLLEGGREKSDKDSVEEETEEAKKAFNFLCPPTFASAIKQSERKSFNNECACMTLFLCTYFSVFNLFIGLVFWLDTKELAQSLKASFFWHAFHKISLTRLSHLPQFALGSHFLCLIQWMVSSGNIFQHISF